MSTLRCLRTPKNELAIVPLDRPPVLPAVQPGDMYAALLADAKCDNTRASRKWDCEMFCRFLRASDAATACAWFLELGRSRANAVATAFRSHEQERGQSPASINRAHATLRRLLKLARRYEVIEFEVQFDDPKVISPSRPAA